MAEKCFLSDSDDSVIEINDETFKNCSLKLAFRKIKNFKYKDVELTNALYTRRKSYTTGYFFLHD